MASKTYAEAFNFEIENNDEDLSKCISILMAMSTKKECPKKNTTICRNNLITIYQGMDRETIRMRWKAFIREVWMRSAPYDDGLKKIPNILYKSEFQTLVHAQSVVASTLYEIVFCNAVKQEGIFKNMDKTIKAHLYKEIPSPHGE